jgi:arginine exporter protein ArgO
MAADQVLMWLAVAGVAAVLAAYPAAFHAVQWVGAAYLAWLGYKLLTAKPGDAPAIEIQPRQYFRQGALITLMNPKAIVFYMAFFPMFVDPARHQGAITFGVMAATVAAITFIYSVIVVTLTTVLAERLRANPAVVKWLENSRCVSDRFWPQAGRQLKEKFNGQNFLRCQSKGGVGKTTTTVNLAAGLAKVGQRVLLIDLDPQGNATMGSGVDKRALELTVYDVLLETPASRKPQKSEQAGYDVLGANRELSGAEIELVELERRNERLKTALQAVAADYDFVLIDCPPSLSMLTLNGLCSAHGVIVPMQCEYFALEGLTDLVNTIKQVHANLNPTCRSSACCA